MRLDGKDEAKGQGDDKMKIYDGYIRLIGFSTTAKGFVQLNCYNKIAES